MTHLDGTSQTYDVVVLGSAAPARHSSVDSCARASTVGSNHGQAPPPET
jgi:hypothetical protein